MGRLVNTKGLEYLVQAMRLIDCKLVISGGGPLQDKLQKAIKKKGLQAKIEMTGRVCEERKCELLSSCKLFVMPSIFESYGIAVAEAMSYGKAIVATDVGGLPEVVNDGGLLCNPRDPRDLADKITSLLKNESLRVEKAKRSYELAQNFTWDSIAPKMEREYLNLTHQLTDNGH
jgi:glycosyltransferase involved in cell wall biosynthesis